MFFSSLLAVLVALLFVTVYTGLTYGTPAKAAGETAGEGTAAAAQANIQLVHITNNMQVCELSSLFPEKIRQWCGPIMRYADENGLPPDLIAALILQESGGNPDAYSKSGAVGLMQVMPRDGKAARFMCKNGPCFSNRPTIQELYDPEFNIQYGTKFLRSLVDYHKGNLREALKSYGPMDMGHRYADIVLGLYERHREQ